VDIQTIVAELKGELTRIGEVIGLLENGAPVRKRVGRPPGSAADKVQTERRGRGLTPSGRRRLSEAMKLRWAQRRGGGKASKASVKVAAAITPKKSGGISAAGRKKLSEAMKKRWAEKKRKAS
jgi:hypothetical protein